VIITATDHGKTFGCLFILPTGNFFVFHGL
jgi:hypothetical protein